MLGLSMTEIVIILGLALLLLGPDQLPSIAKTLGKGMREIRKATDDLKNTFDQEMVRLDESTEPQRTLQPVSTATDPAAARAEARSAVATPADPASARAAARRAAAGISPVESAETAPPPDAPPSLRLVPPEGVVAREAAKLEATTGLEPPAAAAESTPATSAPPEAVKDAK
ncbi:MAG TPA: twin-arginine translocase TatA/TatE family subunit [Myxococcales bacterium]|nr:twin-arginine translocase TatA/TatE family subunit [Myxococcales bacterium]